MKIATPLELHARELKTTTSPPHSALTIASMLEVKWTSLEEFFHFKP